MLSSGQQKQRSMNEFQVKIGFSYATLDPLIDPYCHEKYGCQFNFSDFKENIKFCPVCQKREEQDKFIKDTKYKLENELKNERQLILDTQNQQLYSTYKQQYANSNISKVDEIKEIQQSFNKSLWNEKTYIKLEQILQMNSARNFQYFKLIKQIKDEVTAKMYKQGQRVPDKIEEIVPILMSVVDNKLILFYHKYKIKLELELFDESNPKIKPKIKTSSHGVVVQIVDFKECETYSVFYGKFENIFNQNEAKFFIKKIIGSETNKCAKLFNLSSNDVQQKERLIILGNGGISEIIPERQCLWNLDTFLNELKPNSQTTSSMKESILIANNEPIQLINLKNQTIHQKLCHVCKLPPPQMAMPKPIIIQLSPNQEFDNNIKFDDKLILYKTSKLTDPNMLVQIVSPGTNNVPQSSLKVINHASYLTPVKIPTTIAKFETISCKLIGLRLPSQGHVETDQSDIFPAVLVYNFQQQSVEIELI